MMVFVILLAALPKNTTSDIGLVFPGDGVQTETASPHADGALHLGVKVNGGLMLGSLRGAGGVAGEVGWRLPVWDRQLGAMAELSLNGGGGSAGGRRTASFILSLALLPTFHHKIGPGLMRVVTGPAFHFLSTKSESALEQTTDRYVTVGFDAGAGYLWKAGRGWLLVEARYRLLPSVAIAQSSIGHGAFLAIGYSFFL